MLKQLIKIANILDQRSLYAEASKLDGILIRLAMSMSDAAFLLGVQQGASKSEIQRAFIPLVQRYHPDNQETGDEERMKNINHARDVLLGKSRPSYTSYRKPSPPPAKPEPDMPEYDDTRAEREDKKEIDFYEMASILDAIRTISYGADYYDMQPTDIGNGVILYMSVVSWAEEHNMRAKMKAYTARSPGWTSAEDTYFIKRFDGGAVVLYPGQEIIVTLKDFNDQDISRLYETIKSIFKV